MKSREDFRQALGQADESFVHVIDQVLEDLRKARHQRKPRRRTASAPRLTKRPTPERRAQP